MKAVTRPAARSAAAYPAHATRRMKDKALNRITTDGKKENGRTIASLSMTDSNTTLGRLIIF